MKDLFIHDKTCYSSSSSIMSNYNILAKASVAQATHYSDRFSQVVDAHGNMVYKQANYYSVGDKRIISSVQPQTAVPTNLSNGIIDFKLDNKLCDCLDFVTLEWNLTNSTGGASTFTAAPLWVQRMDIIAGDGSVVYSTVDQELNQNNFWLDRDTYECIAGVMDLSATTYLPLATSLANGASTTFNLPVYGFFKASKLALCALDQALTCRFYFNNSALYLASGADCTVTSMSLIAHGRRLKQNARNELINTYHNGRIPVHLSHLSVDRQTITQNLTASSVINIPLTGLNGHCAYLTFSIRLVSTANSTAPVTYLASSSFDILDGNNASLIGFLARNRNLQKLHYGQSYANNVMTQTGINYCSWAADPRAAFGQGQVSGFAIFTGQETLRITLPSTITTASHIIDVRAWMYENIAFTPSGIRAVRD